MLILIWCQSLDCRRGWLISKHHMLILIRIAQMVLYTLQSISKHHMLILIGVEKNESK